MRTRTRPATVGIYAGTTTYLVTKKSNGDIVNQNNATTPSTFNVAWNTVDTIVDENPPPWGKREGYVVHDRETHILNNDFQAAINWEDTLNRYMRTWTGGAWFYTRMRTNWLTWIKPTITLAQKQWDSWSFEAVQKMRPRFDNEGVSLMNDILEFRQIRDLITPFGRVDRRDRRLRSFRSKTLSRLAKGDLWWEFGVQPLIQTIVGVSELLLAIPKRVKALRREVKKLKVGHYSRPIDNLISHPLDGQVFTDGGSPPFKVRREFRFIEAPVYHATMAYRIDLDRIDEVSLWIKAWCEGLGFTKPLSILWNAIPFSFVLDWFVNVQSFLDAIASEPVIPIKIERFSHSVKYDYRTRLIATEPHFGEVWAADRRVAYYERRPDRPSTFRKLRFGEVDEAYVAEIGSALLSANLGGKPSYRPPKRRYPPRYLRFPKRAGILR